MDGPDRSGKSTLSGLLWERLRRRGVSCLRTREPGGVPLAEALRRVLLDKTRDIAPFTEFLLYEAARSQHSRDLILPALARYQVVLCDRFSPATYAYQGAARGIPRRLIDLVDGVATEGVEPDLTAVIDLPESEFQKRGSRSREDRLEREGARFRRRVREGFKDYVRRHREAFLIDGRKNSGEIAAEIMRRLDPMLKRRP